MAIDKKIIDRINELSAIYFGKNVINIKTKQIYTVQGFYDAAGDENETTKNLIDCYLITDGVAEADIIEEKHFLSDYKLVD